MPKRWILIGVLVGVTLLALAGSVYNLVWYWGGWLPGPWNEILILDTFLCVGSLLGFWAAMSNPATPWRLVAAVLGTVVVAWMMHQLEMSFRGASEWEIYVSMTFLQIALVGMVLMIARFVGLELTNMSAGEQSVEQDRQWIQFSVGSILSWTAATAVLLGAIHYVPWIGINHYFAVSDSAGFAVAISVWNASITLLVMWIALASRWRTASCIILGAVALILLVPREQLAAPEEMGCFVIIQVVYLTLSCCLIRLAGYRLIWRRRVRL